MLCTTINYLRNDLSCNMYNYIMCIEQITNIVIKIINRNSLVVASEQQNMDQAPIQFPQIIIGWSENLQDSINIASETPDNP